MPAKTSGGLVKTSISLPQELVDEMDAEATARGVSRSDVARDAIRVGLETTRREREALKILRGEGRNPIEVAV